MKILHLISSPRGEASFSIKLGDAIIQKLQSGNTETFVKMHDLTHTPFPHLEEVHLNSFFTRAEERTPGQLEAIKHSDAAIAEINDADILVISIPMYNFGIHSTLKAWIDHIARAGVTFAYTENGPVGLIKNKKAYLAIATGGIYSEGPYKSYDFTEPYLRTILGFIGITDVTAFRVEGLNIPGVKETALDKAQEILNHSSFSLEIV
jgi:FMN-dependent NADH-azoreductase